MFATSTYAYRFQVKNRLSERSAGPTFKHHIMSVIRPKAGTTMILAGAPIIVAVAFSLTPHNAQSSRAAAEAYGHQVTVSDTVMAANPIGNGDQSDASLAVLANWTDESHNRYDDKSRVRHDDKSRDRHDDKSRDRHDDKSRDRHDDKKKPTHTKTKTHEPTKSPTTKPPVTTTPPKTVEPTRTELPVTSGRDVSIALAGGGLLVIGVLLLLLRRMARDH